MRQEKAKVRNGARNLSKGAISRARHLRKDMSICEARLWERLRDHRVGYSFRRNHAFLKYWLDFYCPEAKLCIEVDGEQHEQTRERDSQRDADLEAEGVLTLRFPALKVLFDGELVAMEIISICEARTGRPPRFPERLDR
jgi:very-short-patch-repair endonuclease